MYIYNSCIFLDVHYTSIKFFFKCLVSSKREISQVCTSHRAGKVSFLRGMDKILGMRVGATQQGKKFLLQEVRITLAGV